MNNMSYMLPYTYTSNNYYQPYRQHMNKTITKNRMKLIGIGYVKAKPDIALVTLGVVTENKDLNIASEENSWKTNELIETLKKMGIDDTDIKTQSFTITQEYDYIDGAKKFRGYKVQNMLSIIIRDIEKTGQIIDAAIADGANNVTDTRFTVTNPEKFYKKALNNAITNSIEKAKSIESTLKINVNKTPIQIDEESTNYVPLVKGAYMEASQATTPIELGMLEFNAKVESIFLYE